ncbi:Protein FAR1-RELATED SEQUENCE 11 [Frankliniella fusca]|uniref:Protein FAR1-RELATED SEQUENCE 11 n=1 Tax=Frankliniella fusca TaxID=407009 RepID=A0AAE1HL08_9NEOP|nr:Protein FAR1-RELATED SEQUENCE 11 [Frankliniella fusca]
MERGSQESVTKTNAVEFGVFDAFFAPRCYLGTASLEIKIKLITKDTRKKDPLIGKNDPPLPGIVIVRNSHNHHIEVGDSMQYLRGSENLRKTFEEYFTEMAPGQAMRLHEEKLSLKENGEILKADGHFNPLPNTVYYWHREWRKKHFGPPQHPLETLKSKCEQYEKDGTTVVVSDEAPWCVLVCTPIMKRAQALESAGEIIFIDSTGTVDASHSNVTVISTATKIGAVPVCMLMHESQTTLCYTKAFKLFAEHFPTGFGGKSYPEVFMTDNSNTEKSALEMVWPQAEQLLCHFHVVQQEWTWLLTAKNQVEVSQRQSFISSFKKIMYSKTTEELEESIMDFNSRVTHKSYNKRVNDFLDRKKEWVSLFRQDLLMRGHQTNNYSEATIRILKDVILQRIKAYNLVALINYIITVWQNYMKTRILRVAYNRDSKPVHVYENLLRKMDAELVKKIVKIDEHTYQVPSATDSDLLYEVDRGLGVCNCKAGSSGAFCKHQALLYSAFGGYFPNAPPILSTDRYQLGLLALGNKCPPPKFFLGMKEGLEGGTPLTQDLSVVTEMEQVEHASLTQSQDINAECLEVQQESCFQPEEREQIIKEFSEQWERLNNLGSSEDKYLEFLKKATKEMKKISTGSAATNAVINVVQSLKGYSSSSVRQGRIGVQVTSLARRPEGAPKTRNRLPAGRKPNSTTDTDKLKKTKKPARKRQIAESIRRNIAHVKSH